MMTTVNEGNNDKTKVPDEFIFRSVSLICYALMSRIERKCCLIKYFISGRVI